MVKLECKYPGEGATSRGLTNTEHGDPVQVSQAYKSPAGLIAATIEIPLTRGYVTRIDAADRVFTDGRKWHAAIIPSRRAIYARTKINGKMVMLHRLLCPDWDEVDHADSDGLNNCRHNLRDGTGLGKNRPNRVMQRNNTSGHKGVSWNKLQRQWVANIKVNRKQIYLGAFGTPEEAADAYDRAAIGHFGEYAKTNAMLRQEPREEAGTWRHHPPDERTHCDARHEYTPENTYIRPGGERECRQCSRRRNLRPNPSGRRGRICPPGCTCGRHRPRH